MCILESTQHLYDLCKKKSMEINSGDSLRTHSARVNSDSFRVNSARIASSTLWRDASQELFNGSVREEDDEEALQWAALEKLPTYNRLRRGLLAELGVPPREIDIRQLGFDEKRRVLESLMRGGAEDNQQFLLKLRERIDRVGIDIPTVEVRFEKLRVETQVHTGNRALPSISNSVLNMLEGLLNWFHVLPQSKRPLTILEDVSGIVKPGRMALLLGPPSSGKTTLLLALAGILDKDLKVSGKVTYNGTGTNEFVPQRTAAYISQNDLHIPEMTVRETLEFSAKCQGAGTNYDMLLELLRREKVANIKPDANVDIYMKAAALEGQEGSIVAEYILKILGLEACADTMVGNQMIRGISGGEKKRLTTGEMLVGPAKAFFMDEISTGLDTSTTFQIVNCIKQSMQALNGTTIVSLLQPSPEVYELFDDVILLSKGQIVYQGPREHVLEFFEHMGFKCPRRKGVADYLQEVTSRKEQGQYWMHETLYDFVTVKDFANSFRTFHVGQKLEAALAVPFNDAESHPASLTRKCYGVQRKELLRTCMSREFLLMKRNAFVYVFKSMEMTVTALITLTVFLRTEMPKKTVLDGGIFMGSLFFSTMKLMFSGFAELSMTVLQLPVFYKQRELLFYPAWAYSLPKWILKIPISAIEVAIWVLLTYYPIGYDPNVGRFFGQYLLLFLLHNMAFGLFRFIAGIGRTATMANTLGFFIFTIFMVLGGFILSREDVKKWWIWGYWISPLMYLQNALSVNEFLGSNWSQVPLSSNDSLGVQVLKSRGYYPQAYWFWIGVGALIGFIFLFNYMFTLSLKYLNPLGKPQAIIPDESGEEKTNGEGKSLQLSSLQKSSDTQKDTQEHIRSRPLPQPIKPDDQSKKRGMILPFQPLSITFNDIRYSVDIPQAMKSHGFTEDRLELLKGVSGVFRPGVLTALMGVSGAGKTTLMDVLAGRKTGGYIDGEIKISGYPKNQETFARVSGYVEQTDIHSPHVTVYESLLFSAWLRLSPEVDSEVRKRFVSEVMELVELTSLKDALVGLPGVDGLSTEQRKRLTIAVELVANPSIIFMDEPTSGLDARAAAIVLRTVKNTVETGRTIVCTIHQPSIDIFDSFDELLLLKRGGEQIYFGPLGHHACHLIEYFEEINGVSKIKDGHNPATWMMEVSSEAQEAKLGVDFSSIYKNSELYRRTTELIQELSQPAPDSEDLHFTQQHAQPFLNQCMACLWKQNWSYWRNTAYNVTRLLLTLTLAILFGSAFWNVGSKRSKDQDLFNSFGSMYAAILLIGIGNALSVMPIVAVERTVYYRERAAGMYSAFPYAFGQVMIEIPYCMAQTILYGVIVYFMTGYEQTAAKFFWYIFFMFFTLLYFTYYGMMSVAITPNQSVAAIVSTSFYPLWNLFSGFIIPRNRIPIWWRWYYWANPISWSLYGQLASQYGDVKEQMVSGQTVEEFLRSYFGFRHDFVAVVSVMVVGFAVFFALIFAYGIRTLNFQKR